MTQVRITSPGGYRCAPDGHTVQVFAMGQVVTGKAAELALEDGAGVAVHDPRTDTQAMNAALEVKQTHINHGNVDKGGQNLAESKILLRPAAPTPTRKGARK